MPYNYFYAKNGDAAEQYERIVENAGHVTKSGPDAFLSDFLSNANYRNLWLYSRYRETRRVEADSIVAEVVADGNQAADKLIRRFFGGLHLFVKVMKSRADRIICGSSGSRLWICYLAARLTGAKIVHSRHNRISVNKESSRPRQLSQSIDQKIAKRCNAVVCHGPYLVDELTGCGVSAERVLEFDVDFSDFARGSATDSLEAMPEPAKDKRLLLFVGRIEKEKGVFDLMTAFKQLAGEYSDVDLAFAGSGDAVNAIEEVAKTQDLQERVHMLGRVNHTHLASLMTHSHTVVTPTRPGFPEGRCMAAMEAYVAGTPVVAPDYGPFPYLVRHRENGMLFNPGDAVDLYNKLSEIVSDNSLSNSLRTEAKVTGDALRTPPLTFSAALDRAFEL